MKKIFFLGAMLISFFCQAQKPGFYPGNFIRFLGENNDTLYNAFTGGLINPMFSNIDLNNDGRQDLFIFDRRDGKVLTFLSVKTRDSVRLQYAPQYESAFPKMLHWAILKDFNGDGKADIFMHGAGQGAAFSSHLLVYKNISTAGKLEFERYKAPVMKRTKYDTSKINADPEEIPTFSDIDNDGDIDILTFDNFFSSMVYYYKNMSMEKYGNKDSFNYNLYDQCWGYFSEFDTTENVEINVRIGKKNCAQDLVVRNKTGGHDGSTLLAFDHNGDGDKDLLIGDVDRPNLVYLENGKIRGSQTSMFDTIITASGNYPLSGKAAKVMAMPLASLADINGNGAEDIIVSPLDHASKRKNFIWLYNNTSKIARPNFQYVKSNFLEDKMVDNGNYSQPAFLYYNNDSLPDLLVSVQGEIADQNREHLVLYLNVGTKEKAVFKPVGNDFMSFSMVSNLGNISPTVA
ncbi:MAG: FG-GAP repeat domain-containing protein, partial [Bacteroidia bacterium]